MKIKYKSYRKENNCHFGNKKQVISKKQRRPHIKKKKNSYWKEKPNK